MNDEKSFGDCGDNDANNDNEYDESRDEKFCKRGTLKIFYEPV